MTGSGEGKGMRADDERGASLVEFAMLLPLLILLLFGIIESSWAFAQLNDVRNGAREGARLAATNFGDVDDIADEVCARMEIVYPAKTPTVTLDAVSANGSIGGLGRITVETSPDSLTGFAAGLFGGLTLESTIEFRLEQPGTGSADWWNGGSGGSHTCT